MLLFLWNNLFEKIYEKFNISDIHNFFYLIFTSRNNAFLGIIHICCAFLISAFYNTWLIDWRMF